MAYEKWNMKAIFDRPYNICCIVLGGLLIINSLICAIVYQNIHSLVRKLEYKQLAVSENTLFLGLWKDPPMTPKLEVYIYNFTNAYEFLAGNDSKPNFQEIGPYVYNSKHEKLVHKWEDSIEDSNEHHKNNFVSFQHRTVYTKVPSKNSGGRDDSDIILVPNMILMSGMLKSEVKDMGPFLKQNVVWNMLQSTGKKSPILKLTVNEFLWGYEDELACVAEGSSFASDESEYDPFGSDDDYKSDSSFESTDSYKTFADHQPSYRSPIDGRCIFGALRDKNATWERTTLMNTGAKNISKKGYIHEIDGTKIFGAWKEDSKCDSLVGLQEPSVFPPTVSNSSNSELYSNSKDDQNVEQDIDLFVGIMCRSIPLKKVVNTKDESISTSSFTKHINPIRFEPANYIFDSSSSEESCYYNEIENRNLPKGVLGIQRCKFGAPFAVSFPHFYNADEWYLNQVNGVSHPSKEDHEMYIDIEPILGVPVNMQIRFQVNLLLNRDSSFPPLAKLPNELTVLPIFWAQEGYDTVPESTLLLMDIAILTPQIATFCLILGLSLLGGVLIMSIVIKHWKNIRKHNLEDHFYSLNTQKDLQNYEINIHQRFKEHDTYGELRRKSSGDNTGTIDSLLTDSDRSSKNRTSSSNSSSSLNSTKLDPLSETLIPNTCNITG